MSTTAPARIGSVLVGIEALGVLALAAWQVAALVAHDTGSPASAIALLVLTLVGAFAVGAFARGIARGASWGRSGGIVVQLLVVAVALGAATGEYAHPGVALALGVPAAVVFVVLLLAVRDAGRDERTSASDGPADAA